MNRARRRSDRRVRCRCTVHRPQLLHSRLECQCNTRATVSPTSPKQCSRPSGGSSTPDHHRTSNSLRRPDKRFPVRVRSRGKGRAPRLRPRRHWPHRDRRRHPYRFRQRQPWRARPRQCRPSRRHRYPSRQIPHRPFPRHPLPPLRFRLLRLPPLRPSVGRCRRPCPLTPHPPIGSCPRCNRRAREPRRQAPRETGVDVTCLSRLGRNGPSIAAACRVRAASSEPSLPPRLRGFQSDATIGALSACRFVLARGECGASPPLSASSSAWFFDVRLGTSSVAMATGTGDALGQDPR